MIVYIFSDVETVASKVGCLDARLHMQRAACAFEKLRLICSRFRMSLV